jgi:hypothetical protein
VRPARQPHDLPNRLLLAEVHPLDLANHGHGDHSACAGTRVTFLDNDAVEFEGVRILGCTLWTDFSLRGTTQPLSIHARFVGNPLNPGFVSDLTPLLRDADLWMRGHSHDSFDYRIGWCRVVANPAGYILNRAAATADLNLKFENGKFEPGLVLDLAT